MSISEQSIRQTVNRIQNDVDRRQQATKKGGIRRTISKPQQSGAEQAREEMLKRHLETMEG